MKFTSNSVFILLIISSFFYSCSPVPISRVSIDKNDVGYWQNGIAIGEKEADGLIVEAVYSHSDKKFDYFDVAIENTNEERVLIDPKYFLLIDPSSGGKLKAVDPELMILNRELKDSKRKAQNQTLAIVAGAAIVAGTVAAVAADYESSAPQSNDDDDFYFIDSYVFTDFTPGNLPPMNYQYFSQEPLLSTDVNTIPQSKNVEFWKAFTFRKSTLFSNQRIRGLVAFVKNKNLRVSQLIIPTDSRELTFDFVHEKYKP